MTGFITEIRVAFSFLTRIPLLSCKNVEAQTLGRSMAWFPVVGLVLGAGLYGLDLGPCRYLSPPLGNGLLVLFLVLVTGALHLDGMADFCDAFGAGSDRERALVIMKDSHVGSFGAVGVGMTLLLKTCALLALVPPLRGQALLLIPVLGRWVAVLLAWALPYARPTGGTGRPFIESVGFLQVLVATLAAVAFSVFFLQVTGLIVLFIVGLCTSATGWYFKRRFGGVTGDLLGAGIEGAEIISAMLFGTLA